jgi:hypothetical protein
LSDDFEVEFTSIQIFLFISIQITSHSIKLPDDLISRNQHNEVKNHLRPFQASFFCQLQQYFTFYPQFMVLSKCFVIALEVSKVLCEKNLLMIFFSSSFFFGGFQRQSSVEVELVSRDGS